MELARRCGRCGAEYFDVYGMSRYGLCTSCEEARLVKQRAADRQRYKRNASKRAAQRAAHDAWLKEQLDEILERCPGHREPTYQIDDVLAMRDETDYWTPHRFVPAMRRLGYDVVRIGRGRVVLDWRVVERLRQNES